MNSVDDGPNLLVNLAIALLVMLIVGAIVAAIIRYRKKPVKKSKPTVILAVVLIAALAGFIVVVTLFQGAWAPGETSTEVSNRNLDIIEEAVKTNNIGKCDQIQGGLIGGGMPVTESPGGSKDEIGPTPAMNRVQTVDMCRKEVKDINP